MNQTNNEADDSTEIEIEIVGPTTDHTAGPYGDQGCDETMHVIIGDEDVYVPWTGVRASGYDYHGNVPDRFDVDRVVLYDGHIHGDADVEGGSVELCPDHSTATSEFRGYDKWTLESFKEDEGQMDPEAVYDRVVYVREGGDK